MATWKARFGEPERETRWAKWRSDQAQKSPGSTTPTLTTTSSLRLSWGEVLRLGVVQRGRSCGADCVAMLAEEGSQPKLVASNYMNFGFLFESHFLFRGFPVSHFSRAAAK